MLASPTARAASVLACFTLLTVGGCYDDHVPGCDEMPPPWCASDACCTDGVVGRWDDQCTPVCPAGLTAQCEPDESCEPPPWACESTEECTLQLPRSCASPCTDSRMSKP